MRLLLLACLLAPLVAAGDDRPARRVPDQKLQAAINQAIDRGVEYLKQVQAKDGSWPYRPLGAGTARTRANEHATGGLTALALYALGASGVGAADKTIHRGLKWTDKNRVPYQRGAVYGTYSASLLVLALTRIDAAKHKEKIKTLAFRLVDAQLKGDNWTYSLEGDMDRGTDRRAPKGGRGSTGDNSNSQFAVLALWAAHVLADAEIPRRTWQRILGFYERTQLEGGGWAYRAGLGPRARFFGGARPSMTAAGLVSYVYATAALLGGIKALPHARRSMAARKGLAFFHDPAAWNFNNYYFVYSLERVGTVMDLPEKDWYFDGARKLVRAQAKNGRWPARGSAHGDERGVYETSLALLFLSRATRHSTTPGGDPHPRRKPVVTTRKESFPDCSKPADLERAFGHYHAYKAADRAKVVHEFAKAGPKAVALFIRKLRAARAGERSTAYELLNKLVEKKFFFEPDRPEAERKLMLRPIEDFWRVHGSQLRWDPARKLFVVG